MVYKKNYLFYPPLFSLALEESAIKMILLMKIKNQLEREFLRKYGKSFMKTHKKFIVLKY